MHDEMATKALLRAAELVEQGWCQGVAARRAGVAVLWNAPAVDQVCLTTALGRAVGELTGEPVAETSGRGFAAHPILVVAARRLYAIFPVWADGYAPIRWNNTPGRQADDVAAVLRRAATTEAAP